MQGVIFWGQVNELAEIILRKDSVFHKGKQKCLFFLFLQSRIKMKWTMTSFALNNLWTYLQGLSLSQSEREWLANKLIMPKEATPELTAEERKARFLRLAGIWSESAEGEEHYQMMKHRNDSRPANRDINLDD